MSIVLLSAFLLLNLIANTSAQCAIQNFQATPDPSSPSSQLNISWTCDASNNEFLITYQLTNRDQCLTGNKNMSPFDVQTMGWSSWDTVEMGCKPCMYTISLKYLFPYSTYSVTIRSRLNMNVLSDRLTESVMTGETDPGLYPTVFIDGKSSTHIDFSWMIPCGYRHGNITAYEYELTYASSVGQQVSEAVYTPMMFDSRMGVRVSNLSCGVQYTITVSGKNSVGVSQGGGVTLFTKTDLPGIVQNIKASIAATQITINWMEPDERGCPIVDTYEVTCEGNTRHQEDCQDLFTTTVMDTTNRVSYVCDVKPFYSYTITVKAEGGPVTTLSGMQLTPALAPSSPPGNVRITNSSDTTRTITWDEISCSDRNGQVIGYRYELTFRSTPVNINDTPTTYATFELDDAGLYNFSVAGKTEAGTGPYTHITFDTTSVKTPSMTTTKEELTSRSTSTVYDSSFNTMMLSSDESKPEATTGNSDDVTSGGNADTTILVAAASGAIVVVLILIIVIVLFVVIRKRKKKSPQSVSDTLQLETIDPDTKLNDGKLYAENGGFQNGHGGLYPDLSEIDDSKPSTKPRKQLPAENATKLSVQPRKHNVPQNTENVSIQQGPPEIENVMEDSTPSMPPERPPKLKTKLRKTKPVKVESLPEFIAKHKANYSEGFAVAFDDIPIGKEYSWEESLKEANKSKSRYQNIYPYDHSRILLEIIEGVPNSDYINASLVKGYKDRPYIAAQGPSKGSIGDIWRMAWEQKSTKIVMLTNLVEQGKRKCEQYWPETKEPFVCTPMTIRRKKIARYADFIIRDFVLEKDGEKEPYEVRQFHFASWPDMGVPEYPTQLLNFLRLVNAYEPEESGLPILHCSAGVGRTGTFITIAGMLEMAASEGKIDVDGAIRKLRKDRISMVQTREQYEFIFDTVQEALTSGDTGILITNLRQRFNDLQNTVNKKTGKTTLEEQFKILEDLTVVPTKSDSMSGNAPENADKNRFPDREPPNDGRRPYLREPLLNGGTDYINAAFIDGYVRKKEFISTQMPLTNTIEDFWTMVYEFKSTSIVMLNRTSQSDPSFGMYWVESGTKQMNNFTVEFQSKKNYMDEVIGRTFKVYPNENPQDCLFVQQIQLHSWPLGQDTPDSVLPLIAMINAMEKWQKEQPKAVRGTPIVVHCIDGIEASGVFCALVIMLNKMKAEKIVDVFQSVKRVRMSRPGMVQTLDQYTFLYEAAQVSLDEFKTYENFR